MKVTVLVTTYNQEKFIVQAIDGILMQEVDFEYEIVIIDDCSNDNTRDILLDYQKAHSDRIRLILAEENKNDTVEYAKAILTAQSQYIALLDGDDYWTSPHKLQKQVDFLDTHPECVICFHNAVVDFEDKSQTPFNYNPVNQKEISTLEDLFERNMIATCSAMLRAGLINEFPAWYYRSRWGDWGLYMIYAQQGKIGYINDVMAVYRKHRGGVWSGLSEVQQFEALIEFLEEMNAILEFKFDKRIKLALSKYCYDAALAHKRIGDLERARPFLFKSVLLYDQTVAS